MAVGSCRSTVCVAIVIGVEASVTDIDTTDGSGSDSVIHCVDHHPQCKCLWCGSQYCRYVHQTHRIYGLSVL